MDMCLCENEEYIVIPGVRQIQNVQSMCCDVFIRLIIALRFPIYTVSSKWKNNLNATVGYVYDFQSIVE